MLLCCWQLAWLVQEMASLLIKVQRKFELLEFEARRDDLNTFFSYLGYPEVSAG